MIPRIRLKSLQRSDLILVFKPPCAGSKNQKPSLTPETTLRLQTSRTTSGSTRRGGLAGIGPGRRTVVDFTGAVSVVPGDGKHHHRATGAAPP